MGPNWIRCGAIAYFGAVGVSYGPECLDGYSYTTNPNRFMSMYGRPLGEVSDELATCVSQCCGPFGYCWFTDCSYRNDYILLGDPLLYLYHPAR